MLRRVILGLLPASVALVIAFAAAIPGLGATLTRAPTIQQSVDCDAPALHAAPLRGSHAAAMLAQWGDDDPDDILAADSVIIPPPVARTHYGRRTGSAVRRQFLVSAAYPRGPPSS
jgi:hypothetical protein